MLVREGPVDYGLQRSALIGDRCQTEYVTTDVMRCYHVATQIGGDVEC